jgi:Mg-chelatase subunit ChlD
MTYIKTTKLPITVPTSANPMWTNPNSSSVHPSLGGLYIAPTTLNIPTPTTTTPADTFKPKKAGTKTSHIVFVLDDSASMQSCREATISGYNEYLKMQKKDAEENKIETFASLYKFDGTNVNCVFNHIDVNEVEELTEKTYNPNGITNLHDAIGSVMIQINDQLKANKKVDRDSIIITILTDGHENASRTFNSQAVKQMVEKAEGKNWGFMFLGANIDAFAAGSSIGFNVNNTIQYDTASMTNTILAHLQ